MTTEPPDGANFSHQLSFDLHSETPVADMHSAEPFDWDAMMNRNGTGDKEQRNSSGMNNMLGLLQNPTFGRDYSRTTGSREDRATSISISVTADSSLPGSNGSPMPDLDNRAPKVPTKKNEVHTVHFFDNDDQLWGCCVNFDNHWSEWKITKMLRDQQAHRRGVEMGWRIRRVNNLEISEYTCKETKRILEHGHECTITFETDPRSHLITQEGSRKWDSASVEREHEDMEKELAQMKKMHEESEKRTKLRKTLGPSYITQQVEKLRDELDATCKKTFRAFSGDEMTDEESDIEERKRVPKSSPLTLEDKVELLWSSRQENQRRQVQVLELIDAMNLRLSHLERTLGISASRKSSQELLQIQNRGTRAPSERV